MSVELQAIVHERKYIRKYITEQHNKISRDNFHYLSSVQKKAILSRIKGYQERLDSLNSDYDLRKFDLDSDEGAIEAEKELCGSYDEKISIVVATLEADPVPVHVQHEEARGLLKTPTAPLPKYTSAEGEDLTRFFREFEDTVNKYKLQEYDKLQLLRQQVSGRALLLINSLESDKQGFKHAKELLIEALASGDTQKFNIIKQMTELKLPYGDDPFGYVSKMRLLTESVKALAIDTDTFLQYFYWTGLNDSFKAQVIQITNKSRPSLSELNDSFFEAAERYQAVQKSFQNRKKKFETSKISTGKSDSQSSGFAAGVKYQGSNTFKSCSLCTKVNGKDATHPIYRCTVYSTNDSKLSKLREFNGCTKCTNFGHKVEKCTFRLKEKCKHCAEWHFSFLCPKDAGPMDAEVKSGNTENTTSNIITITDALHSSLESESILPTFTCILGETKLRALKDGGCQSNFITESLANSLGLRVLRENISLTINGINTSQNYKTKLVECHIIFGSQSKQVQALCIPVIKISLNIPHLNEAVKEFVKKGYDLADKDLLAGSNTISQIDFILGSKSAYCVPETDVPFGTEPCSVYSSSPIGVLLKGDIEQLMQNLSYLPNLKADSGGLLAETHNVGKPMKTQSFMGMALSKVSCLGLEVNMTESVNFAQSGFCVLSPEGKLNENELDKATEQILHHKCNLYTNLDTKVYDDRSSELNNKLVDYALNHTERDSNGRLVMPLLWNAEVSHLLGTNKTLAKVILKTNLRRLKKVETNLKLMNEVFREQERAGIIGKIDNLDQFLEEHPAHSFLPHMGVFRPDKDTTKCRVVFLSNLCQKNPKQQLTLSHNQCIHSGPSLNQKLSSSLLHLRFDSKLLCFDVKKAFNNIELREVDQNRLLFLWYRNIENHDYTIIGYRNIRLSFGLRCSPTLLMLALYKILIIDTNEDSIPIKNMKRQIYQLSYMDNLAVTMNSSVDIRWAFDKLQSIFEPYKFGLQQFVTNDLNLQNFLDSEQKEKTPREVKLLGMIWDREKDLLYTRPITLSVEANTKRTILSSIASQFDLYNFNGPLLNRSRVFMHRLQCMKDLGWDTVLPKPLQREWKNIVKQVNSVPPIQIKRFVGERKEPYRLIAFADSSAEIYGITIYLRNLKSKEVHFVLAKNRIVSKQLENKSIPSLELQGLALATECLIDLHKEMTGDECEQPVKIENMIAYTDSLVALTWLQSYNAKYDKMQKKSIFVNNRLHSILQNCEQAPITFSFVSGVENPADCITRQFSYKRLMKTNYLTGPTFLNDPYVPQYSRDDIISVTVPNPLASLDVVTHVNFSKVENINTPQEHLIPINRFSDFYRLAWVHRRVLIFVNKLKGKVKAKNLNKFGHLLIRPLNHNFFEESIKLIIRVEQRMHYADILKFFESKNKRVGDVPNLVRQLNVYVDQEGLLQVKSKMEKCKDERFHFPILLPKESGLTKLIIQSFHVRWSHLGCYPLLSELRKEFWVSHYFSTVKKLLKQCVTCKRFKDRTIKLNQSPYRDFRLERTDVPYSRVSLDYMGPFLVKFAGETKKVWVLCIACMYTRAVNLKICLDMTVSNFLRAFQLHCFEFGIPSYCLTDLGSQLTIGANVIMDFLKDPESQMHFEERGVKPITFDHFVKGCSQLGSLVEVCVKLTKKLIYSSIKKLILPLPDFEFLVCQTIHLVNRRPVAFLEALRDLSCTEVPRPITPEILLRGYELISLNVIPELHGEPEIDPEWHTDNNSAIRTSYHKLNKARSQLLEVYHSEFLKTLISQAVDRQDRYKPVQHQLLSIGDIVIIKKPLMKSLNYPLATVKELIKNTHGEVTGVKLLKGRTGEIIMRHVTNLMPLLTGIGNPIEKDKNMSKELVESHLQNKIPVKRKAAINANIRNKEIFQQQ